MGKISRIKVLRMVIWSLQNTYSNEEDWVSECYRGLKTPFKPVCIAVFLTTFDKKYPGCKSILLIGTPIIKRSFQNNTFMKLTLIKIFARNLLWITLIKIFPWNVLWILVQKESTHTSFRRVYKKLISYDPIFLQSRQE